MVLPKNDFAAYAEGFGVDETHISIDSHGQMKGARPWSDETYFGPRIGSLGPDWSRDIPLPPNHHFVIEYFFYMPSPGEEGRESVPAVVGSRGGAGHRGRNRVPVAATEGAAPHRIEVEVAGT